MVLSRHARWSLSINAGWVASIIAGTTSSYVANASPVHPPRSVRSDCYIEEVVNGFADGGVGTRELQCSDGDSCDADELQNGACVFRVALCPNQRNVPQCNPAPPLKRITIKSVPKGVTLPLPPDLGGESCGAFADVRVPVTTKGKRGIRLPGRVTLRITARSSGIPRTDVDKVVLICNPFCETCGGCATANPNGGPDQLRLVTTEIGSDFDYGSSGMSHNFPLPMSSLRLCLSGCDASTNPMCDVSTTPVGDGTLNPRFGPPLPLVAQGIPICVINRYQGPPTGEVNVQTGEVSADKPLAIDLFSDVYLTLNTQVCPRCQTSGIPTAGASGTCDGGPNLNKACTVDTLLNVTQAQGDPLYALSSNCPPDPGQLAGTLPLSLALTTGTTKLTGPKPCPGQLADDACGMSGCGATCSGSACIGHAPDGECIDEKGGISQLCCAGSTTLPCFPTAGGGSIVRTGKADPPVPVWPDPSYPKVSTGSVLVTTFCAGAVGANGIDSGFGLPAPAAIILPVKETLLAYP